MTLQQVASREASSAYYGGIALVAAAALLWSLNGALIKLVHQDGSGPSGVAIAFWRSLIAGLFMLPFSVRRLPTLINTRSECDKSPSRKWPAVLLCVLCFALMTTSFVVATTMTAAANAIILQYTSTFWVFGLSPWLLGEKAALREFSVLGLAMIGIAVIFTGNMATDLPGLLIALSAGLFYGLLTMQLRRVRACDPAALTVANNLGTALLLAPWWFMSSHQAMTPRTWFLLVLMGVVQFGLPYYFFSLGLRRIPAHHAALVSMAEPVLVPLWAFWAVAERPPRMTMIGGFIILAALGIFLWMRCKSAPSEILVLKPRDDEKEMFSDPIEAKS